VVRPALFLLLLTAVARPALAQDARVEFLDRQLKGATDPRVRAQTLLLLGKTSSAAAVPSLCTALKDPDGVIRGAAATGLGDLRLPQSVACLKAALPAASADERPQIEHALELGAVESGSLYLALDPVEDKQAGLSEGAVALANKVLREKLAGMGATFAPPNEAKQAASALVRQRNLKSYALKVQFSPGASANGMKVEMLISTYPEQSLKGSWNVKASGPKPESLIKAMVPRLIDDAAGDLDWKR
jgi:hypothetical protein